MEDVRGKQMHTIIMLSEQDSGGGKIASHLASSPGWGQVQRWSSRHSLRMKKEFTMRPSSWHPPVELSSCEQTIITRICERYLKIGSYNSLV